MQIQKCKASVQLSTDSGVHTIDFDVPLKAPTIDALAQALSKFCLQAMQKALGAIEHGEVLQKLNNQVIALQAELETLRNAKPVAVAGHEVHQAIENARVLPRRKRSEE